MQLLGWRHLVNWGRTLGIGGLLLAIPSMWFAISNGNSIMTGAAEADPWNILSTAGPTVTALVGIVTSLIATWQSTGRISPTDAAVQQAFAKLAVLALNSPTAANLLQKLKAQIDPVKDSTVPKPAPAEALKTPAEYLVLLEQALRLEISQSCIK